MTATTDADVRPEADQSDDIELVPLDSLTAEHTGHWTFLIVDGAAFMMQAMEPVIAEITASIRRHSRAIPVDGRSGRSIRCCAGPTAEPRRCRGEPRARHAQADHDEERR